MGRDILTSMPRIKNGWRYTPLIWHVMAWNRIDLNLLNRVLAQWLWHILVLTCDMWLVPVTYRSASPSSMHCPKKVCKHSEVLYSICVNKCTLLTGLKFSVLFVCIQPFSFSFIFSLWPFQLKVGGFSFLGGETAWNLDQTLVVLAVFLSLKSNFAVMFLGCVLFNP